MKKEHQYRKMFIAKNAHSTIFYMKMPYSVLFCSHHAQYSCFNAFQGVFLRCWKKCLFLFHSMVVKNLSSFPSQHLKIAYSDSVMPPNPVCITSRSRPKHGKGTRRDLRPTWGIYQATHINYLKKIQFYQA